VVVLCCALKRRDGISTQRFELRLQDNSPAPLSMTSIEILAAKYSTLLRATSKQPILSFSIDIVVMTCLHIDAILVSPFESSNLQFYSVFRTGPGSAVHGQVSVQGLEKQLQKQIPVSQSKYRGH